MTTVSVPPSFAASLGAARDRLHTKEARFVQLVAIMSHSELCGRFEVHNEGV